MAFHAFHTLSFPWPALEAQINSKLPQTPFSRNPSNSTRTQGCVASESADWDFQFPMLHCRQCRISVVILEYSRIARW